MESTRAEDARPVEFPLSLRDSTRAEDARPVEFPLSLTDSTRAGTRALWSSPLA